MSLVVSENIVVETPLVSWNVMVNTPFVSGNVRINTPLVSGNVKAETPLISGNVMAETPFTSIIAWTDRRRSGRSPNDLCPPGDRWPLEINHCISSWSSQLQYPPHPTPTPTRTSGRDISILMAVCLKKLCHANHFSAQTTYARIFTSVVSLNSFNKS